MLYRLVYYLVPWVIGIYLGTGVLVTADNAWLAGLARRWEESALLAVLRIPLHLLSALGVRVLSALAFIAGAALLLSAASPPPRDKVAGDPGGGARARRAWLSIRAPRSSC